MRVLFLDASTPELVRRYDATRRRHPLADQADGLVESIELERSQLDPVRGAADLVIDTTDLNVHQLKERIVQAFDVGTESRLQVAVESFGFKHGLPLDADIVMDVRFLPNPHWDDALRPLTGHDPEVRDYVLETSSGSDFVDRFDDLLGIPAAAVRSRRTQLPHRRGRLHRRAAPFGRGRRGTGRPVAGAGCRGTHDASRRGSLTSTHLPFPSPGGGRR